MSGILWLLELFVFAIGIGYVWELVDTLARRSWAADHVALTPGPDDYRPVVSLHVPTHNEPPDLVVETLQRLLALDYLPDYRGGGFEVVVVDNNTDDESLWRPVEAFCALDDRLHFVHLSNWPGYKSGALNYALQVTDPRADVIGIVDADYQVESDWLACCAPLFVDERLSFAQSPQDYRGWDVSSYFRRLYRSYNYFFDVSQRSRNERNGAIFGGTMGLIRRTDLVDVGGWDEWCITEDAELSLRLLKAGGHGLHIDRSFGHGVMPLTFETLKSQRHRWCFGGIQILRKHGRSLLPGRRTEQNHLTFGQRWAYFVGGLQWFGDLAAMLFTGFLLIGAADLVVGEGIVVRRLSGLLLLAVVALIVLGAIRSIALLRSTSNARWGEAFGAFGLWLALGPTVARAAWQGLFAREGQFLRTPKQHDGDARWTDAIRGTVVECVLAALCWGGAAASFIAGGAAGAAVGGLLTFQGVGFALAPLNSWAALRTVLPIDLRRRQDRRWSWGDVATPVRRGSGLVIATGVVAVGMVAFAAPIAAPELPEISSPFNGDDRRADETTKPPPASERSQPDDASSSSTTSAPSSSPSTRPSPSATAGATTPGSQSSASARSSATPAAPTEPADDATTKRPGRPTDKPRKPDKGKP